MHFLIDCPFYDDLRDVLFRSASNIDEHFNQLNSQGKFEFLMIKDDLQYILAKTLFLMFRRRKSFHPHDSF